MKIRRGRPERVKVKFNYTVYFVKPSRSWGAWTIDAMPSTDLP